MPEPISIVGMGLAKLFLTHSATAAGTAAGTAAVGTGHFGAILFTGVAVGSTMWAICVCLKKLVEAGAFSERQATGYKNTAAAASEEQRQEMKREAQALCARYGL